jgi:hypothetical protein
MKALSIDPCGRIAEVALCRGGSEFDGIVPALRTVLGCAGVEALGLGDGLTAWVDENGIAAGGPVNWSASLLARELLDAPVWLHGMVVVTGFDQAAGCALTLTGRQEGRLRRRLAACAPVEALV